LSITISAVARATTESRRLATTSVVQWTPSHTRLQAMSTMSDQASPLNIHQSQRRWT